MLDDFDLNILNENLKNAQLQYNGTFPFTLTAAQRENILILLKRVGRGVIVALPLLVAAATAVDCMLRRITRSFVLFPFLLFKINKMLIAFCGSAPSYFCFISGFENSNSILFYFLHSHLFIFIRMSKKRLLLALICFYDKHLRVGKNDAMCVCVSATMCVCSECVFVAGCINLEYGCGLLKIIHVRSRNHSMRVVNVDGCMREEQQNKLER